MLLQIDRDDMPVFYATNLTNTPPMGYNNVDKVKLLQQIQGIQNNTKLLSDGHISLTTIVKEHVSRPATNTSSQTDNHAANQIDQPAQNNKTSCLHAPNTLPLPGKTGQQ